MMKRLLLLALLAASSAFGANQNIGTENTTTKTAGVATFANSTFCLKEPSGTDKACLNAPALSGSTVLTTPATTGTLALTGEAVTAAQMPALTGDVTTSAGAVATTLATVNSNVGSFTSANITVNAKGLITAAANGGGGVAGSNTQVQYNNSGAFGASSTFTWNSATSKLGVGNATPFSQLANSATDVTGSDTSGTDGTNGLVWANNAAGYTAGLYNASNTGNANGLAVKIRGTASSNVLLDLSTGATQNAAGTSRFAVYGDGSIKINGVTASFTGDVVGPSSATSGAAALFDGTTGKLIKDGKVILTIPATSSTLTILNGKTLTVNKTLTLDGTDSTTMTFPTTSATIARTDAANTFTGVQVFSSAPTFSSTTASRILFAGTSGALTDSANLAWDDSNQRLNLFGATSTANIDIFANKTVNGGMNFSFKNSSNGTAGRAQILAANDNGAQAILASRSSGFTTNGLLAASNNELLGTGGRLLVAAIDSSQPIILAAGGFATTDEGLRIVSGQAVMKGWAIASLPTGTAGGIAYVTDQLTTCPAKGAAPTAGGSVKCPVFFNGSSWVGM